ncbi:MAG TPA: stage 0 sporulation family protein [Firmicutes bacterium]|nr:stage 0 sporulation family protein [Candidatus Fermentithermobacillaceae bacterium]
MPFVVGIRFRPAGKIYYFDPGELELPVGTRVVVETVRGTEIGMVVVPGREVPEEQVTQPLKKVIRVVTPDDLEKQKENREKAQEALAVARQKVQDRGLDMKLVDAEYTLDRSRVVIYFTADGRVDFRELVRDLASTLRSRVELRQIGVRDEAKILGGIGPCGRQLCCASFLSEFYPVSIRMAKEQNLSLNPAKISGVCGRLLCCLRFESELARTPDALTGEREESEESLDEEQVAFEEGPEGGTGQEDVSSGPVEKESAQAERPPRAELPGCDGTGDCLRCTSSDSCPKDSRESETGGGCEPR